MGKKGLEYVQKEAWGKFADVFFYVTSQDVIFLI